MFNTAQEVREFMFAGNATITLESQKTLVHMTYRIKQATDRNGDLAQRWFVSILNGPDNENSYAYIGLLDTRTVNYMAPTGPVQFRQTAKARFGADTPSVRGFVFFWNAIAADKMPCNMWIRHEGRCGRCNRKLTTPESIDRGIGPECAGQMGMDVSTKSEATPRKRSARKSAGTVAARSNMMAAIANSLREYAV